MTSHGYRECDDVVVKIQIMLGKYAGKNDADQSKIIL